MKKGNRLRSRILAWWYWSIAAGFVLLGLQRWMLNEGLAAVLLRWAIALGFVLLGIAQWQRKA